MKYYFYHFKTTMGEEVIIRSTSFESAEKRASERYNIIEYLGWTEKLESEK